MGIKRLSYESLPVETSPRQEDLQGKGTKMLDINMATIFNIPKPVGPALPTYQLRIRNLRTLSRYMTGPDVRWLHALLNWHLPRSFGSLPIYGSGSDAFGPLTEGSVKKFQEIKGIDRKDRARYKDGIVGLHTWRALHELYLGTLLIEVTPPPTSSRMHMQSTNIPSQSDPAPSTQQNSDFPSAITPMKLEPDGMLSVQLGETRTIPFTRKTIPGQQVQIGILLSGRTDGKSSQTTAGFVGSINVFDDDANSTSQGGVYAQWQSADIFNINDTFKLNFQIIEAILGASSGGTFSQTTGQFVLGATVAKNKNGDDTVVISASAGRFLEIHPPHGWTKREWDAKSDVQVGAAINVNFYSYPFLSPLY
jgi:hypothetical protein